MFEPGVTYFKPAGVRMVDLEESIISVEEFEAVRLKDLEGLNQEQAAKKMNISQPTFHRLVQKARKKIADAIVNGKAIKIQGGDYRMVKPGTSLGFCECPDCGHQEPKVRGVPCLSKQCPKCGVKMVRGD
jgi:predicted DNA-binding protein (UPF0251 family)